MKKTILYILLLISIFSCKNIDKNAAADVSKMSWEAIESSAKGSTVQFSMWQGDPLINRYMQDFVVPELKKRYDITLKINAGQGNELVKTLMAEKENNISKSAFDMCWINGETFYQLRQIQGLHGGFVSQLPNSQYINFENPFIKNDFQQATDGYECPWGNVQMTIIYDSLRTPKPPLTLADLETYLRAHQDKFTIPNEFTGMTFLKSLMIGLSGDKNALDGAFDEAKYQQLSKPLWDFINRNKSYFWRQGKTFPESLAAMHLMFANGELDFTMSNNDCEVENKISQNIFAPTSKAYVFDSGTIQNSHFLGIATHAPNKAGAMVVINFLISPEAQLQKLTPSVWGDGTVLDIEKLPTEWREKFHNLPARKNAPSRKSINEKALQEPAPEYMIRIFEDFRKKVMDVEKQNTNIE